MPRYPDFSNRVKAVPRSVFEEYLPQYKKHQGNLIPFHLGDTYMQPAYDLPLDEKFTRKYRYHNRYCNTFGVGALLNALAQKVNEDNGFSVSEKELIITNGAINGLNAAVFSIMNPGEEILVLTPCWPFFMGIINIAEASIKQVPFYPSLFGDESFNISSYLEKYITDKTVAVYFNSPNNPTGKVLSIKQMMDVAAFVKKHQLWLISDEAYESFVYDGLQHYSIANIADIFNQTFTVYSFAKMFMVAGYRLGYIVANRDVIEMVNKILVHQIYSASSLIQYMLIEPVKTRKQWLPEIKYKYEQLRNLAVLNLDISAPKPQAGYFYFFSLKSFLKKASFHDLFSDILANGIALTPGESFGRDYKNFVRLCFTSVPESRLLEGLDRLNMVLKRYKD